MVVPVGDADPEVLASISGGIGRIFSARVKIDRTLSLPDKAYDARRRQYRAGDILEELRTFKKNGKGMVLGVTDKDIYVPKLNFVFGEASALTGCAVISLARLKQEFYGLQSSKTLLHARTVKEAVHELGHIFCLDHCPNPRCVMYFSNSIEDTDRKGPGFCKVCADILGI